MTEGKSSFVYVTYIRTTPEKLWAALTQENFIKQYWLGIAFETDWKVGSPWRMVYQGDEVTDEGEVVEADPPRRLALRWRHLRRPGVADEGYGLCVIAIEPVDGAVKLTLDHSIARAHSQMVEAVSGGWPMVLSNLKSLLETDRTLLTSFGR